MLIGYFDESGTHAESPTLAVAGILGPERDWSGFESSWRWFLDKYSIPAFHMASFENRHRPFADWPDTHRLHCIKQAHRSLAFHASAAIASAVILADYAKVVSTPALKKTVGSAYCLAIKKCLTQAVNWSKAHAGGKRVAFVFEDGADGKGEVQAMFQEAKDDPNCGPFIDTLEFRGKDCLPLQGADIVAYEVWKQMANQRVAGSLRPVRKSLYNILSGLTFEDCYFDEENLLELVKAIGDKPNTVAAEVKSPGAPPNNEMQRTRRS